MTKLMNPVDVSIIEKTRKHFADICDDCIEQANAGVFFVNNIDAYVQECKERKSAILKGEIDHTFTFKQRAHWLRTGVEIPFMSI